MSDHKRRYATIFLPYFKQGDDLNDGLVKDENGTVDTKATLRNHMLRLEAAIAELKEIHDTIPDVNSCVIDGDTHHIGIEGDERIINELVSKELAQIDEWWEEEQSGGEDEFYIDSGEYSSDDSDDNIDSEESQSEATYEELVE